MLDRLVLEFNANRLLVKTVYINLCSVAPILTLSRTLTFNGAPDHLERLTEELNVINNMEMWRAGKTVRQLRPENEADKS